MFLRVRRVLVSAAFVVLVGGCSAVDTIYSRHDTINRNTEQARNEAILLNILRASHSAPLNFISFATISGTTSASISAGPPQFLVGPGLPANASPGLFAPGRDFIFGNQGNLNVNGTASNNFVISTFETKDFYEALLRPVDLPVFNYFVRQGYSRELLFWLFADSVEETVQGKTYGYRFVPGKDRGCNSILGRKKCFDDLIEVAVASGLAVETRAIEKPSASASGSAKGSQKAGGGVYARFCFDEVLKRRNDLGQTARGRERLGFLLKSMWSQSHLPRCRDRSWKPEKENEADNATDTLEFIQTGTPVGTVRYRIITRSTFGIYRFLGQLLAAGGDDDLMLSDDDDYNVLTLTRASAEQYCFDTVYYGGETYCVPDRAKNTKQILSLLSQLVALQTNAQDLAITPTVRVLQ